MRWWRQLPCLLGVLAGLALFAGPQTARAQQNAKQVSFTTADGVDLSGTWYAGNKNDATVLLLHPIGKGEDSNKAGWDDLAKTLNKKGYSVLRFDFRGHGNSTGIANVQKFYAFPQNRQYVKPNKAAPGTISVEDYGPAYYPILVNDIAAAKSYLDLQNDAGACNSSALVVIGADNAAALAAIWLNSEWQRYKIMPPQLNKQFWHFADEPEGQNTVAAVFLSINPKLGKQGPTLPLQRILFVPGQQRGVPMLFVYGDEDKAGKAEAKSLEKALKTNKFKEQKFTGSYPIQGAGKASGRELLQGSLKTGEAVTEWVGAVLGTKTPAWSDQEFKKSLYVWGRPGPFGRFIPNASIQAKAPNEAVINWSNYAQFAR